MSTNLSLVHCPICDKSFRGYQVFMDHVLYHPLDDEIEINTVQGSKSHRELLQTPSKLVQHSTTMLMSTPTSSYGAHLIRGNDDAKVMHKKLQLPTPPSYRAGSIRRNIDDTELTIDLHANKELPLLLPLQPLSSDR